MMDFKAMISNVAAALMKKSSVGHAHTMGEIVELNSSFQGIKPKSYNVAFSQSGANSGDRNIVLSRTINVENGVYAFMLPLTVNWSTFGSGFEQEATIEINGTQVYKRTKTASAATKHLELGFFLMNITNGVIQVNVKGYNVTALNVNLNLLRICPSPDIINA